MDYWLSNARIRLRSLSIWIQWYFCVAKTRLHICSQTQVPRKQYENNYLFLVFVEFQLSNIHSVPHSSYFSPMVVWGLRKGIIFNPNRPFRDTKTPLQLQKLSINTFMVERVSKQTKSCVFKNKSISKLLSFIGICRLSALQRKNQAPQFVHFSPVILFGLKRKWISLFRNGNFEKTKLKLLEFYGFHYFSAPPTHIEDTQFFQFNPGVLSGLNKKILNSFIPNWQFRLTNTRLHIENCQTTPLWKRASQKYQSLCI